MVNVPLRDKQTGTLHASSVNAVRAHRGTMLAIVGIAGGLLILAGLFVWFGESLDRFQSRVAFNGRTMDTTPIHLSVADKPLVVPANMIRFPAERRDGAIERVNLLLHWPDLDGFSKANADAFRDNDPSAPLVFVTIFAKDADYGTTGWLDRIYTRYFSDEAWAGPNGLVGVKLTEESGYEGEDLFFEPESDEPFVARCVADGAPELASTCLREILVGEGLIARYRFDKALLGDWEKMDPAIRGLVEGMVGG